MFALHPVLQRPTQHIALQRVFALHPVLQGPTQHTALQHVFALHPVLQGQTQHMSLLVLTLYVLALHPVLQGPIQHTALHVFAIHPVLQGPTQHMSLLVLALHPVLQGLTQHIALHEPTRHLVLHLIMHITRETIYCYFKITVYPLNVRFGNHYFSITFGNLSVNTIVFYEIKLVMSRNLPSMQMCVILGTIMHEHRLE